MVDGHSPVEDNNLRQRLTHREHPLGFVILILLSHKEEADLGIAHHELYLLLRTGGIERDGYCPYAPCAEVAEQILNGVLREDAYVLLNFDAHVEHSVRHFVDRFRKLVPRIRLPGGSPEIFVDEGFTVAQLSSHVVYEARKVVINLLHTPIVVNKILQNYFNLREYPNFLPLFFRRSPV